LSASDLERRYLWNPTAVDSLLADETIDGTQTADDILWPLADHLNTTRDVVRYSMATETTSVANHLTYDAFGNVTSETSTAAADDTQFHHTGKILDEQTGNQWHQHRWYDPRTARWQSADPIGFDAGDLNLYRYVGNSPQYSTDSLGLLAEPPGFDNPENQNAFAQWLAALLDVPVGPEWDTIWEPGNLNPVRGTLTYKSQKTWTEFDYQTIDVGLVDVQDACGNRVTAIIKQAFRIEYYLKLVKSKRVSFSVSKVESTLSLNCAVVNEERRTGSAGVFFVEEWRDVVGDVCDDAIEDFLGDDLVQQRIDLVVLASEWMTPVTTTSQPKLISFPISGTTIPAGAWEFLSKMWPSLFTPGDGGGGGQPAS
jgi:RHS repeat-associated protein